MTDSREPVLRAGSAFFAYGALLLGMVTIGFGAQQRGVVAGLWITEVLAIALPAIIALRAAGVRFAPYLGLRAPRWRHVIAAVVLGALNQPVVSFLTWTGQQLLPASMVQAFEAQQRMLDAIFAQNAGPMLITVVIAAPLGEELFFRGFALPALQRSLSVVGAVLVSGALFSLLHMNAVGFLGLMEIGVLLAALRHWSGSLWPAIVGHAVNNGIAGAAFMLGWEDPQQPTPAWVLALGATLFCAGVWLLRKVLQQPSPAPAIEERVAEPRPARAAPLAAVWALAVAAGVALLRGVHL